MRMLGWFAKLFATAILLSALSVFTTVYVADQYIQGLLRQWNLRGVERPSFDLGDYVSALTGSGIWEKSGEQAGGSNEGQTGQQGEGRSGRNIAHQAGQEGKRHGEGGALPGTAGTAGTPGDSGVPAEGELAKSAEEAAPVSIDEADETGETGAASGGDPASAEPEPVQALPVFGAVDTERFGDALVMSAEEFNEKRKQLTDDDKMEIFSIMMARLPQEEFQRLSHLLEGGITEEEARQLEEVIHAYLHQDEVARLLAILSKY